MPYKFLQLVFIILTLSSCYKEEQAGTESNISLSSTQNLDNSEVLLKAVSIAKKELFICKFDQPLENCTSQTQLLTDAISKSHISGITQERISASEKYGEILGERASKSNCEKKGFKWALTGCLKEVNANAIYKDPVTGIESVDVIAADEASESAEKMHAAFDRELELGKETPTIYGPYRLYSDEMDSALEYASNNCRLHRIIPGDQGFYVYCFPNR